LNLIATRSRGTPRIANRLLKRVRDYAQVKGQGKLTTVIVESSLKMEQIDVLGLDELDRSFLRALAGVYEGGPAGIEAIAATLGEERDTLRMFAICCSLVLSDGQNAAEIKNRRVSILSKYSNQL
jgi:Holliday junction DNA helicase RuvB